MLRALLGGFLLLFAHAVETRAQNARARGSACWECLVSEEDMQTSWIVRRYLITNRGVHDVHASASPLSAMSHGGTRASPGAFHIARHNFRQLFLHSRATNEEADKVVATDFWFTPSPSSSRASRGAKRSGGSLGHDAVSQKSVATTLKGRSRATGKRGFYFFQIKHRGWMPPRVCTCACSCSYEQIPWFSKGRFIK